ncbi:MAG: FliM/FliN family flagellar motor switch protein [Candidatus Handelsmanbacteria bacterium]|nr:FliM/FliN family flagellar motor switch protein [Candidatus Handelsmanbacteria bacterium]
MLSLTIRSQEEINARLREIHPPHSPPVDPSLASPYDFKHPAQINKDQLRTLKGLHDNFARLLASTLSGAMRQVVEVKTAFVEQTAYSEFIMSLSNPYCIYEFTPGPTAGRAVVDVAMPLVFAAVDGAFGGRGSSAGIETGQPTAIEMRVINRIFKHMLADLEATWQPLLPVAISEVELETNPEVVQVVAAQEIVIVLAFEVNMPQASGLTRLCYPFFTLKPLLPLLGKCRVRRAIVIVLAFEVNMPQASGLTRLCYPFFTLKPLLPLLGKCRVRRAAEKTAALVSDNRLCLGPLQLPLVAELGRVQVALAEVRSLQVGDILRLPERTADSVPVYLGGKPKFLAHPFAEENGELKLQVAGPIPAHEQGRYGTAH